MEEFCLSLRIGGRVPREVCSDAELRRIFATVDADKSGAVDAAEFCGWLRRTLALARSVTNGSLDIFWESFIIHLRYCRREQKILSWHQVS